MSEPVTIILVFLGVMVVTTAVFAVWLVATIIKLVSRGIAALIRPGGGRPSLLRSEYQCPRASCRQTNPASARFCRRCGKELLRSELIVQDRTGRQPMERVALW